MARSERVAVVRAVGFRSYGRSAMSMSTLLAFWSLLLFVPSSEQQKNPVTDFCRRFSHQTAVVDRKLYIDGGLVDWNPISQNNANYSNSWLLYNDLNSSLPGIGQPQLYANLSKNASIPDLSGGVLWADEVNKRLFSFGGDYYQTATEAYDLYSYDVINNVWDNLGSPGNSIASVSYGGGASVSDIGKGYMYGGWLSNASVPGWTGAPLATTGLIEYDMDTGTWKNNSGPDTTPRAEGAMVYLPASISGVLVYFGGVTTETGSNIINPEEMTNIHIFDIQSSKWYTQTATGDVPPNRRRFCAGATWADDQSSYNIYLYGGLGFGTNATGFDDVYILSLPTFTWIKWWPTSPGTSSPHHSLSCNVIARGQMLIIGGTFPLVDSCDSPESWGTHNLNLGQQNSGGAMWYQYQPNLTSYQVPSAIISVVGGGSTGGASTTTPSGGFENRDLSVYFAQKATAAGRSPTRIVSPVPSKSSKKGLSSGAIAGIAVGGAVLIVALLTGAFCLFRRHRSKDARHQQAYPVEPYGDSPHNQHYAFPATSTYGGHSPTSPQITEYQQLPANPISTPPVELAGNDDLSKSPKSGLYRREPIEQNALYGTWPHNPNGNYGEEHRGLDGSQAPETSPTPTYASMGRSPHSTNHSQSYFPQ